MLELAPPGPKTIYVLEISSYQIDLAPGLMPDVAVLSNITPDHIDRHGSMEELCRGQGAAAEADREGGSASDRRRRCAYRRDLHAPLLQWRAGCVPVSVGKVLGRGVFVVDGMLYDAQGSRAAKVMDLSAAPHLPGAHNWQNAALAYAADQAFREGRARHRRGHRGFPGLAHRIEDVGRIGTVQETLAEAGIRVVELIEREAEAQPLEEPRVNLGGIEEVVADKGYHSGPALEQLRAIGVRTYIPEKKQAGKRHWVGKEGQQQAVYANRRRLQRPKGKRLLRKRGELIERTFAHCYETGGMRRTHLRKHNNILKRLLVHVAGMNLGLLLRTLYGVGTPRSLQGLSFTLQFLIALLARAVRSEKLPFREVGVTWLGIVSPSYHPHICTHFSCSETQKRTSTPGC